MKVIVNKYIPFKGFAAINLFGVLFVRPEARVTERMLRHEVIHTAQMKELLYIPFYLLYFLEWLIKLCLSGSKAYRSISFEREAYVNETNPSYLQQRTAYAFLKLL